jgi:hypothetical protein
LTLASVTGVVVGAVNSLMENPVICYL